MTYAQPETLTIGVSGVYKDNIVSWLTAAAKYIGSATYLTDAAVLSGGMWQVERQKYFLSMYQLTL